MVGIKIRCIEKECIQNNTYCDKFIIMVAYNSSDEDFNFSDDEDISQYIYIYNVFIGSKEQWDA